MNENLILEPKDYMYQTPQTTVVEAHVSTKFSQHLGATVLQASLLVVCWTR